MQYCNAIKTRSKQHSLLLEGENSCSDGEALTPVLVTMSRYDGDHSMMYDGDHDMKHDDDHGMRHDGDHVQRQS